MPLPSDASDAIAPKHHDDVQGSLKLGAAYRSDGRIPLSAPFFLKQLHVCKIHSMAQHPAISTATRLLRNTKVCDVK